MKPIPEKLKKEMANDPYYHRCALTGTVESKYDKIEWHHAWTYAHGQINEKWAIMPILHAKHSPYGDDDSVHNSLITRRLVKYLSLCRTNIEYLKNKYPKVNWEQEIKFLKDFYNKHKSKYKYLK